MSVTTTSLTRAAGASAVVAGLLFCTVQINHPVLTLDFVTTVEFAVRQSMKVGFTVLALAGITGMYLSQVRKSGVLGLIGYLIAATGFLTMFAIEVAALVVMPASASTEKPTFMLWRMANSAVVTKSRVRTGWLIWTVQNRRPATTALTPAARVRCVVVMDM